METVLIIGIKGAIGKVVADLFTANGIRCIGVTSRRETIAPAGKDIFYMDLEDLSSIVALKNDLPALHAVIFCAGLEPQYALSETDLLHHRKMMDIHVTGPLFVVQTLKEKIKKGGSVIFISSVASKKGSYDPSYSIAKSAVEGMTRTLAKELATDKIRVNAISPGLVKGTPVHKRMTPDFRDNHMKNTLLQQLATPIDCAEAIYFLYKQKQITGQLVHINGGQYFGN